jgi:activator of HSP90 ATPase
MESWQLFQTAENNVIFSSDFQRLSLKGNVSQRMKKIICLYDGSAVQYTTRKQFLNLTLHHKD